MFTDSSEKNKLIGFSLPPLFSTENENKTVLHLRGCSFGSTGLCDNKKLVKM